MRTHLVEAVRKASKRRLLSDMRLAQFFVQEARERAEHPASYVLGAADAPISATLTAALMTAFGE